MSEEFKRNLKKSELTWSSKEVSRDQCDAGSPCISVTKAVRLGDRSCMMYVTSLAIVKNRSVESPCTAVEIFIGVTEIWWGSSCNWKTAVDRYTPRK